MLGVLEWIYSVVSSFGTLVLWGVVSAVNLVLAAVGAAVAGLFAVLPHIENAPAFGTPTWLHWLSWFYPVGDLVAGLVGLVGLWVSFLVFRYLLNLLRAL